MSFLFPHIFPPSFLPSFVAHFPLQFLWPLQQVPLCHYIDQHHIALAHQVLRDACQLPRPSRGAKCNGYFHWRGRRSTVRHAIHDALFSMCHRSRKCLNPFTCVSLLSAPIFYHYITSSPLLYILPTTLFPFPTEPVPFIVFSPLALPSSCSSLPPSSFLLLLFLSFPSPLSLRCDTATL